MSFIVESGMVFADNSKVDAVEKVCVLRLLLGIVLFSFYVVCC